MKDINFNSWWNNYYFIATKKLKMTYAEFLESTPRMIMGQDILNRRYEENILLTALSKIYGSMNSNSVENVEYAQSLSDLF